MWVVVVRVTAVLFGDEIVRFVLYVLAGLLAFTLLEAGAQAEAIFAQPFGQWWAAGQFGATGVKVAESGTAAAAPSGPDVATLPLDVQTTSGNVTDVERYQLAVAAGFVGADAVTAVAVSIAEDGSGNPAALSPPNFNGTRDLGLWQINSGWWPQFGGQLALIVPINNARAAYVIYGRQGWCAWSTYNSTCGPGHTGSYAAFLGRARAAAQGQ